MIRNRLLKFGTALRWEDIPLLLVKAVAVGLVLVAATVCVLYYFADQHRMGLCG